MADATKIGIVYGNALSNVSALVAAGVLTFESDDVLAEVADAAETLARLALGKQDALVEELGDPTPARSERSNRSSGSSGSNRSRGGNNRGNRGGGNRRGGGSSFQGMSTQPGSATDAQLNKLDDLGVSYDDNISKQEASDLIEEALS